MLLKHNLTVKICYDEGLWWAYVKRGDLVAKEGADSPSSAFQKLGNLMKRHGNYSVLDFATKRSEKRPTKLDIQKLNKAVIDLPKMHIEEKEKSLTRLEIQKGVKTQGRPGSIIEVDRKVVDGKVKFYSKEIGKEINSGLPKDAQRGITGEEVSLKINKK